HRARMEIIVTVKGRSCHASAPERGDNPISKMADIIKDIDKLNRGGLRYDKLLGVGTVAVTAIECKTASFHAVAGESTSHVDRRSHRRPAQHPDHRLGPAIRDICPSNQRRSIRGRLGEGHDVLRRNSAGNLGRNEQALIVPRLTCHAVIYWRAEKPYQSTAHNL